jgi:hypothetical protein
MAVKEVAIVGLSPATHDFAPFWDGTEKWGMPWDEGYWRHYSRLFEMHDIELIRNVPCRKDNYSDRLRDCEVPLYMQEKYYPNATPYPFDEVAKVTGAYWNSSIAYMLALAITEGYEKISVYGVDMRDDEEYFYQRPNCEYLIGLARGRGIEVVIPDASPLCKFNGSKILFGKELQNYPERYGKL